MRILFFIAVTIVSISASAQMTMSQSAYSDHKHSVSGYLGMNRGGLSLGGDYEMHSVTTMGIGGLGRYYSKNASKMREGLIALGGFVRPQIHQRNLNFHMTLGAALYMIDGPTDELDATAFGPLLGYGVLLQWNKQIAFGAESTHFSVWTDEDYNGVFLTDLMLKLRFNL